MQDCNAWSLSLVRLGGIQVRVHASFLLIGIVTMYLSSLSEHSDLVWYGGLSLVILFLSVLLHELGHCYAAVRAGGRADEVIIGPLGGLAQPRVPREPQSELATALAGPAVNLLLCVVAVPLLALLGDVPLLGLLNPLRPQQLVEGGPPAVFLKLTFWLNWVLVLLNLLPAFPFDGGRALRAVLWPVTGYRHAAVLVSRVAKVTAVALCLVAWWMHEPGSSFVYAWVPLMLLTVAVLLFFSARQEVARGSQQEASEDLLGYDFSQGYTSLERDPEPGPQEPGLLQRWVQKRREEKERLLREREAAEEDRVDAILAQLHGRGLENLSAEDRDLLQRVSARYRNRLKR